MRLRRGRSDRARPRLGTVLLLASLAVLAVPVAALLSLRVFASALVRSTEEQLIAQGAVVAAAFAEEVERERATLGISHALGRPLGRGVPPPTDEPYAPVEPRLVAAGDLDPRPLEPRVPARPAEPVFVAAGDRVTPVLREAQRTTLAAIRVVDPTGVVVASTRGDVGMSLRHWEEVHAALAGRPVSLLRERSSDSPRTALSSLSRSADMRVFVALPVVREGGTWGVVVLSRTPKGAWEALAEVRGPALVFAAGTLALAAIVAFTCSRLVTRPVKELVRRTARVARGDRTAAEPLQRPGTREVEELSRAFSDMARALQRRTEDAESFASHVAHELKGSLTSIRGTAELLSDHLDEMSVEQRGRFLAQLQEDAARLERMVARLLELARAEGTRPSRDTCDVCDVMERVAARHRARGATVVVETARDLPPARIAEHELDSALDALVDNACRHGGGVATLRAAEASADRLAIDVENAGAGVSESNGTRLFEPFFTTTRATGGTGLGLTIARTLLRAQGGDLELASAAQPTVFRVTVPRGDGVPTR